MMVLVLMVMLLLLVMSLLLVMTLPGGGAAVGAAAAACPLSPSHPMHARPNMFLSPVDASRDQCNLSAMWF